MNTGASPAASDRVEKIWLNAYPQGVPAEVDVHAFSNVLGVLDRSIDRFGDLPAFANMGSILSYAELGRKSNAFAAFLQQELHLSKGERVALMMPNLLQYPVAIFGVLRAGLTVTNVNPLYTPRELKHQLADSGATTLVILENFCHVLEEILPETPVRNIIVTRIGDLLNFPKSRLVNFVVKHVRHMVPPYRLPKQIGFPEALRSGAGLTLNPAEIASDDIAFLQYTAGTTGLAKGALLTHANIVANLQQASGWLMPFTEEGREIVITPLPLYHIFSLTANCLFFMKLGGLIYLITNPRDFKGFVRELKKVRFTAITGVNTLYNALLNTPGFADLDFSSLRIPLAGGMALQRSVAERWKAVTGRTLIDAYGLTETSPGVCINPIDLKDFNGKIGLPLPSTECSIQSGGGIRLGPGEVGEICVRGPQVTQGYWNRPDETRRAITPDGWFHTGDIGTMDEQGFFQILERKDDMIEVSGFNVYPSEVEAVLTSHPGVLEAAAIGIPDEKSGETVKAFVVRKDATLTAEELDAFCRRNLAGYKRPKAIEFRDSLPKSNVGKILRRELR